MKLSFRKAFCLFLFVFYLMKHGKCSCKSMSSPESSGSLASGWLPGETLGNSNIIGCLITACIVLPQKSFGTKSPVSPSLLATNPWPKNLRILGARLLVIQHSMSISYQKSSCSWPVVGCRRLKGAEILSQDFCHETTNPKN